MNHPQFTIKEGEVRKPRQPKKVKVRLLENHHFAEEGQIIRLQLVEIDTAGDVFADVVSAVPIGGTTSVGVVAFLLMTQIQTTNYGATHIINSDRSHRWRSPNDRVSMSQD